MTFQKCLQFLQATSFPMEQRNAIFLGDVPQLIHHECVRADHIHVRHIGAKRIDVGTVAESDWPVRFSGQDGGKQATGVWSLCRAMSETRGH